MRAWEKRVYAKKVESEMANCKKISRKDKPGGLFLTERDLLGVYIFFGENCGKT